MATARGTRRAARAAASAGMVGAFVLLGWVVVHAANATLPEAVLPENVAARRDDGRGGKGEGTAEPDAFVEPAPPPGTERFYARTRDGAFQALYESRTPQPETAAHYARLLAAEGFRPDADASIALFRELGGAAQVFRRGGWRVDVQYFPREDGAPGCEYRLSALRTASGGPGPETPPTRGVR